MAKTKKDPVTKTKSSAPIDDNTGVVAVLSYFIVGIIWYFLENKVQNRITTFHVKQSLNLFIIAIIIEVAAGFLTVITLGLFGIIAVILQIGLFILWIIGIINASQKRTIEIPIIGEFAKKYLKF